MLNKLMFVLNVLVAFFLLTACLVPYIPVGQLSFLGFLSLSVPLLVVLNLVFVVFWVLKWSKKCWYSFLVLVLGYFTLGTFIKFNESEAKVLEEDLSILSYNVRVFNRYEELDNPRVFEDIKDFVFAEKPDVICFQEPSYHRKKEYLKQYPYHSLEYIHMQGKVLLGFFSKYPILKTDFITFPDTPNNAIYADILYKKDTIRIYNVHLQSLGVTPGQGVLKNTPSNDLVEKVTHKFKKQEQQAKMLEDHMRACDYKQIVCGDFNNNQFSKTYKIIKGEKQDSFIEKGLGYGRTLNFHKIPMRIDFILADHAFKVKSHKNYDVEYSDHYPIMASFELKTH